MNDISPPPPLTRAKPCALPRDWAYLPEPARTIIERLWRHGPRVDLTAFSRRQLQHASQICRRTIGHPPWITSTTTHPDGTWIISRDLAVPVVDAWALARKADAARSAIKR